MRTRLSLVFGLFLMAGCGGSGPVTPTSDFLTIDSIAPAAGTTLNPGDRVTFTAVVTCTLVTSNGGFVVMIVQDQGNRSLNVPGEVQPQAALVKGTAIVTLANSVTIPPSGSTVTVAVPMFVTESSSTRAVVTKSYPVR